MKIRIYLFALILLSACLPAVHAQEYGQIRALRQRAAHVTKQKNDFISQVLASYAIPHKRNVEGVVISIYKDGQWVDVTTIEIVPVLKEAADKRQHVAAHELLFYTADGVLDLVSEMPIR
jgi:hypothetical protein